LNLSKRTRILLGSQVGESWLIKNIEKFGPKFNVSYFVRPFNRCLFNDGKIYIYLGWPTHNAHAAVSKGRAKSGAVPV